MRIISGTPSSDINVVVEFFTSDGSASGELTLIRVNHAVVNKINFTSYICYSHYSRG